MPQPNQDKEIRNVLLTAEREKFQLKNSSSLSVRVNSRL